MNRITLRWTITLGLLGCQQLTGDPPEPSAPSPDSGEIPDAAASTEELLATAAEAADLALVGTELNQALLAAVGDPRFIDSIPMRNALTDFQCDRLDGLSVGHCPTYSVTCSDSNEITGLTATFAASGCAACVRGGDEMSGTLTFSRDGLGTYTVDIDALTKGALTIDGSVQTVAERDTAGAELTVRTIGEPLTVTHGSGEDAQTFAVTLDPFSFVAPNEGDARLILASGVQFASTTGRSFSLETADADGNSAPLRFLEPTEGCRGPSTGSLTYERVLDDHVVRVAVTFGADAGLEAICSRPDVTASIDPMPTEEDVRTALTDLAAAVRTRLEERAGNVRDEDLFSADGASDASDALGPARHIAELLREGELANAIEDGWASLVCGATTALPCTSGSGSTTVSCVASAPTDVSATFAGCVLNGILYDGALNLHRELPEEGSLRGSMTFASFTANGTSIGGELTLVKTAEPPALEVDIRAGEEGLRITRSGAPECELAIRFDVFHVTATDQAFELEFAGEAESSAGTYGLETIASSDGHHALWSVPPTCSCPNAGTTVDIESPFLSGLVGAQVTMRVAYGPADDDSCATVSVDFTEWPYSALRKAATAAAIGPVLESACVAL